MKNVQRGMTPESGGARGSRVQFGGVTQIREGHREQWGFRWMETLGQGFAARGSTDAAESGVHADCRTDAIGWSRPEYRLCSRRTKLLLLRPLAVKDPGTVVRLMNWFQSGYRDDEIAREEYEFLKRMRSPLPKLLLELAHMRVAARSAVSRGRRGRDRADGFRQLLRVTWRRASRKDAGFGWKKIQPRSQWL